MYTLENENLIINSKSGLREVRPFHHGEEDKGIEVREFHNEINNQV